MDSLSRFSNNDSISRFLLFFFFFFFFKIYIYETVDLYMLLPVIIECIQYSALIKPYWCFYLWTQDVFTCTMAHTLFFFCSYFCLHLFDIRWHLCLGFYSCVEQTLKSLHCSLWARQCHTEPINFTNWLRSLVNQWVLMGCVLFMFLLWSIYNYLKGIFCVFTFVSQQGQLSQKLKMCTNL